MRSSLRKPLFLSVAYAFAGLLWIVGTDRLVNALFPARASELQTLKGIVFVIGTALVIYGLLWLFRREERAAWRAREVTERWYRTLIEKSSALVWVLGDNGRISYASPAFVRDFLPPELPVEGTEALSWVDPDDQPVARAALIEKPGDPAEIRLRHYGNGWRLMQARATDLRKDPAIRGIVVHLLDLTESRRMERQVLQSQRMVAVGKRVGGIAHDFNNLLTVLTGYVDLVLGRMGPGDPGHEDVVEIQRATHRATGLVRQLLTSGPSVERTPRTLDVNRVISEIHPMLQMVTPESISLETHLEDAMCPVLADLAEMEQVLLNLVVNARDAMPTGGVIRIETESVALRSSRRVNGADLPAGEYAILRVADTGQGMDPDTLRRALEPFFTTKPAEKGTGLGLSTVRGIVEGCGGRIHLDSAPGRGARVEIWLPRDASGPNRGA